MRENIFIFIIKFVLVSLALFPLFYWGGLDLYISGLDFVVKNLFKILGIKQKFFSYPQPIMYNILPFISLMIITRGLTLKNRLSKLLIGFLLLVFWHFILAELIYFLHSEYGEPSPLYKKLSVPIYLFSETLPFFLWIILARINVAGLFLTKK